MGETVQQIDESEFRPEHLAGLIATKFGVGKEGRLEFVERATRIFGFLPPRELDAIWNEATNRVKGEEA